MTVGTYWQHIDIEPWMKHGRCVDPDENADDWFPKNGRNSSSVEVRHAIEVCGACPVKTRCLQYAVEFDGFPRPLFGIWGGMTASQRRPAVQAHNARKRAS